MGKIKLTWHGHSCFTIEEDGYVIALDPYEDGSVPGFGPLALTADKVVCSHGHRDHNARQCVTIDRDAASKKNPFSITSLPSFHDDAGGKKRGNNTISILDDGEYKIAHMGDIGCEPTKEQKEILKGMDVMLMPVGGFFTLEPDRVYALVRELGPKMLVPMHYRGEGFGYDVIAPLDQYLSFCDKTGIVRRRTNTLFLPGDMTAGTIVLEPPCLS